MKGMEFCARGEYDNGTSWEEWYVGLDRKLGISDIVSSSLTHIIFS